MNERTQNHVPPGSSDTAMQAYELSHAALARQAAGEGIVLLQNRGNILPLKKDIPLALYGAGASQTVKGGTGSGDVNARYQVSIYEGLKKAGFSITTEDWCCKYDALYHQARQNWRDEILKKTHQTGDFFSAYAAIPFVIPSGTLPVKTAADTAIYVLGRISGENADRDMTKGDYYLTDEENAILTGICSLYRHVILIVNTGGIVDLAFLDTLRNIDAVLYISQPGMEGGNAVADVLSGHICPSGKLTDSWAFFYEDYPSSKTFPRGSDSGLRALYEEGIYIGYRYFDTLGIPVRYSFGFGLSYTRFTTSFSSLHIDSNGVVHLRAVVANEGQKHSGKEVVQVYVSAPEGRIEKELRRLVAFAKTKELTPGEKQLIELQFTARELAFYDESDHKWVMEAGVYTVFIGNSLDAAIPIAALAVPKDITLKKTAPICSLHYPLTSFSPPHKQRQARLEELLERATALPIYHYKPGTDTPSAPLPRTADLPFHRNALQIVSRMSKEQLIAMTTGEPSKGQGNALGSAGVTVPGSAGETSSCAVKLGLGSVVLADGPAGLRLNQSYHVKGGVPQALPMEASIEQGLFYTSPEEIEEKRYQFCTAFPVGTLMAQSWNIDLLEQVGAAVGDEMQRFGVGLWLAPGMNIHRNPLCGRNYEYFSEDPLLSGKSAAAITRGVQSKAGCGVTIKHYCCNNQERDRMESDSIISERALREIYLKGFEICISDAHPMAIMSSYNLVNGIHAANSYDLCTTVARDEFGFDGLIVTDWTTTEHGSDCTAAGCIKAGNDLIMPGQRSDQSSIRSALETGQLSLENLKECVIRIVRVILALNRNTQ